MPFIPHTENDVRSMLDVIGIDLLEALFDEIPPEMRAGTLTRTPEGRSEMEMLALLERRARQDEVPLCFIGAGCYDHHIPAAVWDIAQRGEYLTAYTPYQAEASQGTLQLIYEYQSMLAALTGMDVSNASVYDGASGLAEAILMAVRANKKNRSRRVLVGATVHPHYRQAAQAIVRHQDIELSPIPMTGHGRLDVDALDALAEDDVQPVAIVVQHPNFFGALEDVDRLADWGAAHAALVIAVVNPLSLALLQPPAAWGGQGADIVCGDGQPLGIPMASGGPSFGFICCRQSLVRQMPGRIIGRTVDLDGRPGFALTLQAREQHIRRAKATSNICTNQGLLVTAATIHMSLLGARGLAAVASRCHANTHALAEAVTRIPGVTLAFDGPFFHERVVRLPAPARDVVERLSRRGILAGYPIGDDYPGFDDALLMCATEKRTGADIECFVDALAEDLVAAGAQSQ
jgi:glycine dehydrogenase subunit 1